MYFVCAVSDKCELCCINFANRKCKKKNPAERNACNENNLLHYLSSVYSFTIPLHVSGLLVAHHQEVALLHTGDGLLANSKHVEE
jgi:hypothetical protein